MADISMCNDTTCPSRHTCFRYLAIPDIHRQAYFLDCQRSSEDKCRHYWQIDTNDKYWEGSINKAALNDNINTKPKDGY